ncbi:MAG: hypothetical protein AABY30_05885 [Candidatus Thermoplasmatota archaeon]
MGRALQRALGVEFVLPEVEPREGGTSLLMNPRRQRVFEYVWNYPCSHLRRISRELRIPPQSLRWHLLRLRESRLLASRKVKGKTVYYAPWAIRDEDVPLFASLSNGVRGRIVRFVAHRETTTQSDIFRGLETYQQAVLPPLGELTGLGLLKTWKENGKRFYVLGDAYARLQVTYAEASEERLDRLLAVLRSDGVSPKVRSRGEGEVQVQVSSGVEKSVLRLRLAPAMR